MAKTIVAVVGDFQIGGNTAIAPPEFTINRNDPQKEQVVRHNSLQAWLWSCWLDYWTYIDYLLEWRGRNKKNRLVIFLLGDIIDGIHHGTTQNIPQVSDQILTAIDVLMPHVDSASATYGLLGTEAHAGKASIDEAAIYTALGVEYGQHFSLEIDGVVHDLKHHGRIGQRPWTSAAAGMAVEAMVDYAECGLKPPNFVWRAHNHRIDDSGTKIAGTRAVCIPSWQLKTSHGHRVSTTTRADIGGCVIDGGKMDDTKMRYFGQPDGIKVIRV